jgi:general secretion pathway protein A
MYEEYYGFAQSPFTLTPDPKFLYRSESHDKALQQVWQAIRRKEGFIVLAGDIGTGKTTLCRTILEQFDPTTFTALILDPFLSQDDLVREVLLNYGVVSRDALRTGRLANASTHDLIRTLHDFLLSLEPIHGSAVLIIDEAQHLSPEVLEEIRILSNLETNERKLLLIVLVGQLNLLDLLRDPKLRQLDQRISMRCVLRPLNREGVEAYITHRLWVAKGQKTVTFTPEALTLVNEISGGVPRVINLLCDRALMAGAEARTNTIDEPLIRAAASVLGLDAPAPRIDTARPASTWRLTRAALAGLIVLLIAITVGYAVGFGNPLALVTSSDLPRVPPPAQKSLGVAEPTRLPAPETLPDLTAPNIESGAFSVVVGTFDTPQEAESVAKRLHDRRLPVYAVNLAIDGAVRRRILLGRFTTRDEAVKAQMDVAKEFPQTRIVYGWFERVP